MLTKKEDRLLGGLLFWVSRIITLLLIVFIPTAEEAPVSTIS